MGNNDVNFDICQILGVNKEQPFDEIIKEIEIRLEKFKRMVDRKPEEESIMVLKRAENAYKALLDKNNIKYSDDRLYDFAFNEKITAENKNRRQYRMIESEEENVNYKIVKERKIRQAKKVKIKPFWKGFVAGVLVCVCAFGSASGINHMKQQNEANNVCVEYQVQEEDSKNRLDNLFREYGYSYLEVSGMYRNENFVYAGDVVIGRTTKEKADELVAEGYARIISVDEAVELLGENQSLKGEFKAYAKGDSDMVFFVPEEKTMI